ncbi:MAG: Crp/Fnr family transcriptional regulator [Acidobacteria bacterium]|nr:Crp/Fnr family transcriptional regulator [Acidobacteriota bacterium]
MDRRATRDSVAGVSSKTSAKPVPTFAANLLLATLQSEERDRLAAKMDCVEFSPGQILCDAGDGSPYTYFPTSGLTSILAVTPGGDAVGLAAVGNEGAIGWPLTFSGREPACRVVAEVTGRAHRIRSDALRAASTRRGALQSVLLAHTQHVMAQISQSVVCQRFHTAPERLARWLLAVCDHTRSNRLRLTQVGIARVLGIHRTGVTAAASELKLAGVIWYQHGRVVILNRKRLEREACDCYRAHAPIRDSTLLSPL